MLENAVQCVHNLKLHRFLAAMYQLDFLCHFVWLLLENWNKQAYTVSQKLFIEFPIINLSWGMKMIYNNYCMDR